MEQLKAETVFHLVAARLLADHRATNPRSRAVGLVRFVRNGGRTKQRGCVLCGANGPSWCGEYKKTKRAEEWELAHAARHVEAAIEAARGAS